MATYPAGGQDLRMVLSFQAVVSLIAAIFLLPSSPPSLASCLSPPSISLSLYLSMSSSLSHPLSPSLCFCSTSTPVQKLALLRQSVLLCCLLRFSHAMQSPRVAFHHFIFRELCLVSLASWISAKNLVKLFCVVLGGFTLLLWAKYQN